MAVWQSKAHWAFETFHVRTYEDTETGIMREVRTTYRNGHPCGPERECYWHPSEPARRTHPHFENCLAAITQTE